MTSISTIHFNGGVTSSHIAVPQGHHRFLPRDHSLPEAYEGLPTQALESGWDLDQEWASIGRAVTRFLKKKNDNRYLLPTMVEHVDVPDHQIANSTVLSYLLLAESGLVMHSDDARNGVKELLNTYKIPIGRRLAFY